MENNMKELNLNEMKKAAGGINTDRFTMHEEITYYDLKKYAESCKGTDKYDEAVKALNDYVNQMVQKYGEEVLKDRPMGIRVIG